MPSSRENTSLLLRAASSLASCISPAQEGRLADQEFLQVTLSTSTAIAALSSGPPAERSIACATEYDHQLHALQWLESFTTPPEMLISATTATYALLRIVRGIAPTAQQCRAVDAQQAAWSPKRQVRTTSSPRPQLQQAPVAIISAYTGPFVKQRRCVLAKRVQRGAALLAITDGGSPPNGLAQASGTSPPALQRTHVGADVPSTLPQTLATSRLPPHTDHSLPGAPDVHSPSPAEAHAD